MAAAAAKGATSNDRPTGHDSALVGRAEELHRGDAEKKLGGAQPPATAKAKDDQMLDQANKSIQRTEKETTATPSGRPAIR